MLVRDGAGTLLGAVGISGDLSDKDEEAAIAATSRSEERHRALVHNSADVVSVSNTDAVRTYVSPTSRAVMGFEPEELIGANGYDLTGLAGSADQIVSDTSMLDLATLGRLGALPDWPGEEQCPPQPMVGQTRAVLDRYQEAGGSYREVVVDGAGHSPHVERPEEFRRAFFDLLTHGA